MKKYLSVLVAAVTAVTLTACGGTKSNSSAGKTEEGKANYSIGMITDTGGINDQSYNQSAWEGLKKLNEKTNAKISYLESKQASDYKTNLDKASDSKNNLIWAVGYGMADSILNVAQAYPDINYAIVDNAYENTPDNVTGIMFRAQEPSFLVGYIAGKTTTKNKVGFVGGMKSGLIDQFQYGYQAGVAYAAKEMNKKIDVVVQYAESYSDAAKGKAIASKMFSDGCDIVFHAAGGVGVGVIEAAKESGHFAIGVDRDQSYLAPDNVLTSALKIVGNAVQLVSEKAMNGEKIGGQTFTFGIKEDCAGIPEVNKNMDPKVYQDALELEKKIADGTIVVPYDLSTYESFIK